MESKTLAQDEYHVYRQIQLHMNTIYIGKFCYTPMINSKYKIQKR